MVKLSSGLYKIEKNETLINEANGLLSSSEHDACCNDSGAFYEVVDILNRIINDRSNQMDDATKDFIGGRDLDLLVGQSCRFLLDKETEEIINLLFEREKNLKNIKIVDSAQEMMIVRRIR